MVRKEGRERDGFTDHSDVCGLVKGRAAITVVSVETSTMLHQQLDLTHMAGKASLETSSAGATVKRGLLTFSAAPATAALCSGTLPCLSRAFGSAPSDSSTRTCEQASRMRGEEARGESDERVRCARLHLRVFPTARRT